MREKNAVACYSACVCVPSEQHKHTQISFYFVDEARTHAHDNSMNYRHADTSGWPLCANICAHCCAMNAFMMGGVTGVGLCSVCTRCCAPCPTSVCAFGARRAVAAVGSARKKSSAPASRARPNAGHTAPRRVSVVCQLCSHSHVCVCVCCVLRSIVVDRVACVCVCGAPSIEYRLPLSAAASCLQHHVPPQPPRETSERI